MGSFIPLAAELIMRQEGFSPKPYRCTEDKWSIGYGTNLEDRGISETEAEMLMVNDLITLMDRLERFSWWEGLNDARRAAVISMCYQLGMAGFLGFKKTIAHIENKLFTEASREMLNSRWAKQTPNRAREIARIIGEGKL